MTHKKSELLWPTQCFHYTSDNWAQEKDKVLNVIYNKVDKQPEPIASRVAPYIKPKLLEGFGDFLNSPNVAVRNLKYFMRDSLIDMYKNHIHDFDEPKTDEFDVDIFESWYHVANDGASHGFHTHPTVDWACIFYAQTGDCSLETNNGINRFYNFNTMVHGDGYGSKYWHGRFHYDFEPVEGDMIIFPGWLPHEATPYTGKDDRIVISINTRFNLGRQ